MANNDDVNTIDELMSLDPLSLTSDNIDAIIAYHRKARASAIPGKRPAKGDSGPKLDPAEFIAKMTGGATQKPTQPAIRRR